MMEEKITLPNTPYKKENHRGELDRKNIALGITNVSIMIVRRVVQKENDSNNND